MITGKEGVQGKTGLAVDNMFRYGLNCHPCVSFYENELETHIDVAIASAGEFDCSGYNEIRTYFFHAAFPYTYHVLNCHITNNQLDPKWRVSCCRRAIPLFSLVLPVFTPVLLIERP